MNKPWALIMDDQEPCLIRRFHEREKAEAFRMAMEFFWPKFKYEIVYEGCNAN